MINQTTNQEELLERLAMLEHEQWREWSHEIAVTEKISPERLSRWKASWVDYQTLPDAKKESDRVYARKVLKCLCDMLQRPIQLSPFPDIRLGDVVEISWLDAGMSDKLRPEDLQFAVGLLETKSYGFIYAITDYYIVLLQNRTQGDQSTAGDGNSVFRIPIGTVDHIRVLERKEHSQNGVFSEKTQEGSR